MPITREWLEATDVENAEITEALLLGLGIGRSFKINWHFGVTEPPPAVVAGDVVGEAQGFYWIVTKAPAVVAGDVVGEAQWVYWIVTEPPGVVAGDVVGEAQWVWRPFHHVRTTPRREELEKEPSDVEAEELKQFASWLAQRLDGISDGLESIHRKNKESQKKIEKLLQISDLGDE